MRATKALAKHAACSPARIRTQTLTLAHQNVPKVETLETAHDDWVSNIELTPSTLVLQSTSDGNVPSAECEAHSLILAPDTTPFSRSHNVHGSAMFKKWLATCSVCCQRITVEA
eukprot:4604026-Amphidinium_carterae.1